MSSIQLAITPFMDMPYNIDRRISCPECDPRRKNKGRKDLSIKRTDEGIVYNCWHCQAQGIVKEEGMYKAKPITSQPKLAPLTPAAVTMLNGRGISQKTAEQAGCFTTNAWFREIQTEAPAIGFPYKNKGQVYASKLRSLTGKYHSQAGACQSFWLIDQLGDLDRVYITEGEFDALAMMEAGFKNVISVPNGAPSRHLTEVKDKRDDRKFSYVHHAEKILEQIDEVYLCGDMDEPGEILLDELARRLGKHRCWKVKWPEKDANDTLLKHGAQAVRDAVEAAERIPVAGLYEAKDFAQDVINLYERGYPPTYSVGYTEVDRIFKALPGTLTVVTGIPSSGKSEMIDQFMVNLAEKQDWTIGYASFENKPDEHIRKLLSKRTGKPFFEGRTERMSRIELEAGMNWLQSHIYFIYQANGSMATIDDIIERLTVSVIRYGIRAAIIDPMNYIERSNDMNETQWVSDVLTRLRVFAQAHDVAVFLVAHPTKQRVAEDGTYYPPKGYEISGSANFFNKADFGLTVHVYDMNYREMVSLLCWKSRFSWAAAIGEINLIYDPATTRYSEPSLDTLLS